MTTAATTTGRGGPLVAALGLADLLTVGDRTDENGRLLLEDSASPRARRRAQSAGLSMRAATCPYQDTPSRLGGRMNIAAYDALRADTSEILDGFAWLTAAIVDRDPPKVGTVQLLYDVSYLGITLPLALFHRATDPVSGHGSLPTFVASIFKASRGLFSVAVALLNEGGSGGRAIDAADVVRFADRHGHLVRPDPPRVCAAPTRLIERTIAVILTGHGATASASRLPDLVDFALLWRLYRVQDELAQALSTFGYVLGQLSTPHLQSTPEQLFGQRVPGTTGSFGQLTEAVLAHVNSSQVGLNRILGRDDNPPPVTLSQLMKLL